MRPCHYTFFHLSVRGVCHKWWSGNWGYHTLLRFLVKPCLWRVHWFQSRSVYTGVPYARVLFRTNGSSWEKWVDSSYREEPLGGLITRGVALWRLGYFLRGFTALWSYITPLIWQLSCIEQCLPSTPNLWVKCSSGAISYWRRKPFRPTKKKSIEGTLLSANILCKASCRFTINNGHSLNCTKKVIWKRTCSPLRV